MECGIVTPEKPDIHTHKEIVTIKRDISDIKATQELNIRVNREKYLKLLEDVLGNSTERAKVFLAVDGIRSLVEISQVTNLPGDRVRRGIGVLKNHGLIQKVGMKSRSAVYAKHRWAVVLRADDWVRERFGDTLD